MHFLDIALDGNERSVDLRHGFGLRATRFFFSAPSSRLA